MSRDLMRSKEVKDFVREAYGAVSGSTTRVAERLYSEQERAQVPEPARSGALGMGNHVRFARIEPGARVIDIGCGSGIDTMLAARRTGPRGSVIALDFLAEMLQRTEQSAREAGLGNVQTLEGEMEDIPLADDSIDVVISNGVFNLSPRKARAFAESARVLRAGGELCVSDLTLDERELPTEILTHPAAWAG